MQIKVEIPKLKSFISAMKSSPEIIAKRLDRAIRGSIIELENRTLPITPIDTGHLRNFQKEFRPLYGSLNTTTNYAIFVHEGTSKWPLSMSPKSPGTVRQFMKKGIEASESKINEVFSNELDGAMEDIARKV